MISIPLILDEELEQLKSDIILRHEQSGQVASGKTKSEFEKRMPSDYNGQLLGAGYSGVLERGRKPGGVPKDFIDILKRWAQAKGLSFKNEEQFDLWANAVKWKIIREGTKLYQSGQTQDIFTTPIDQFYQRLSERITNYYEQEITNEIFINKQ